MLAKKPLLEGPVRVMIERVLDWMLHLKCVTKTAFVTLFCFISVIMFCKNEVLQMCTVVLDLGQRHFTGHHYQRKFLKM